MFLDISKTFHKIWQEGLILKLGGSGIYGNLLYVLRDFLKYLKQKVLLNGQNF